MAFGILRCALAWIGTSRDDSYLAVWKIIDLRLETVTLLYAINTRTVNACKRYTIVGEYIFEIYKIIGNIQNIVLFQVTFLNLIRIR